MGPPATNTPRPVPTNTPRPPETATPVPVALTTANVSFSGDPNDSLGLVSFIGEVSNNGAVDVDGITVRIELLDDAGEVVARGEAYLASDFLLVGQQTVWAATVPFAPPDWKTHRIKAKGSMPTATSRAKYSAGLVVTVDSVTNQGNTTVVTGHVQNGGSLRAELVRITVAGYDEAGKLLAVPTTLVTEKGIEPGATGTFTLLVNQSLPKLVTYVTGVVR